MTDSPASTRHDSATFHSELFTVRLWREQLNDHWEWRGKVQHVTTGEVRYFRDWTLLIAALQEMLSDTDLQNEQP